MSAEAGDPTQRRRLCAWWLGQVPYEEAVALQSRLQQEVLARRGHPGYLLLLEHPSVITAGRSADLEDLCASPQLRLNWPDWGWGFLRVTGAVG